MPLCNRSSTERNQAQEKETEDGEKATGDFRQSITTVPNKQELISDGNHSSTASQAQSPPGAHHQSLFQSSPVAPTYGIIKDVPSLIDLDSSTPPPVSTPGQNIQGVMANLNIN